MSMQARIEVQNDRAAVVLEGVFSTSDWEKAFHAMLAEPGFRPGMSTLWDFRSVEGIRSVTKRDLQAILVATAAHATDRGKGHTALVMNSDLAFGLGRMFEMMSESELSIKLRVFRDREQAEYWLKNESDEPGTLLVDQPK